jgi:uncharacterized protein (TIGR02145 family)
MKNLTFLIIILFSVGCQKDPTIINPPIQECGDSLAINFNPPYTLSTINNQICEYNIPSYGCSDIENITYHDYTYKLIEINGKCWFAENLRTIKNNGGNNLEYNTYPNNPGNYNYASYNTYGSSIEAPYLGNHSGGKLYNQIAAVSNICPSGWHVPSQLEFESLIDELGGNNIAGYHLKGYEMNGSNLSGLDAKGAGYYSGNGSGTWGGFGYKECWWTTSTTLIDNQYGDGSDIYYVYYTMEKDNLEIEESFTLHKNRGNSIRCVKD